MAAEVIAGELLQDNKELAEKLRSSAFNARVIPSVAYTDPEVAWAGLTKESGIARRASRSRTACSLNTSGRAIATVATKA